MRDMVVSKRPWFCLYEAVLYHECSIERGKHPVCLSLTRCLCNSQQRYLQYIPFCYGSIFVKPFIKNAKRVIPPVYADFFGHAWGESWTFIKTVVDVVREPVLILDKELVVMAANESFYNAFQVVAGDTIGKVVYDLGNGQWDIPALRKLLEDILPKDTFFKGFEVTHEFPDIGQRVMILNARQIHGLHSKVKTTSGLFPPIILLAFEDVTEIMAIADAVAGHQNQLDAEHTLRTQQFKIRIEELEKEVARLQKN